MTRREWMALPLGLPLADGRGVALLMRASDGSVVFGDSAAARSWVLPPGSTCKPFVMQTLLQTGQLKPAETFLCPGKLWVGGHNLSCSHPSGLPPMDVAQAIAYSCNCATARFAQRLTAEELAAAFRAYGFRVNTVDVRLLALGEEGVLVTPFDLANAYRRLAQSAEPAVRAGLEGAVRFGTGQRAAIEGVRVAGKTGTVTTSNGMHAALFAGFEPSSAPEYVAVVATPGQSGGADAAPLAAELFRRQIGLSKASRGEAAYRVRFGQTISSLGVEEYVVAVLAGEASVFRQAEALKAMAVAARTYAANQKGRHAREGFDFCNTTHCQRAEPGSTNPQLAKAAEATQGEILRFHHSPAFTPYTMSCGGTTESVSAVWPALAAAYLRVQRDEYCEPVVWIRAVLLRDAGKALRDASLQCPEHLQGISVLNRTQSGRARQLMLAGDGAQTVSAGAFRFALGRGLGWNSVRSDWFDVAGSSAAAVEIRGKGEGHGVGLCQRGAEAMAARGFSHRDILAFYYPGTSTVEWVRLGGEGIALFVTDPAREGSVLAAAEGLAGHLPWRVEGEIEIYLHPTVEEFRTATREPGWVAARTEGKRIDLQPKQTLDSQGILISTLHHELLHIAVENRAVAGLPVWFREGIVEWLAGNGVMRNRGQHQAAMSNEDGVRDRSNKSAAYAGYREARAKVADLVAHYSEATVLGWVAQGLPEEVTNSTASTPPTKSR